MSKTLLVIQREFLTRVRKKSFIILTILMPFIMAALVFVPIWLSTIEDDDQKAVAVADETGKYLPLFKDDATWRFVPITDPDNAAYYADTTHYEAVIRITADLTRQPKAATILSRKEVAAGLLSYTESVLNEQVRRDKLAATGIQGLDRIIEDIQSEISVSTLKRNAEGDSTSSNTHIAMAAGFIFTFIIYMFVMSYGGMVMQSVMEEKTNRIVELMVSAVSPFQLMLGKIVGIALVGLTQLAVWVLMLTAILTAAGQMFGTSGTGEATMMLSALMNLPFFEITLLFILFFIGGYLLYASLFAAIGASINAQEDAQQFMTPMIVIMVFAMYAGLYSAENTNGPLAFWSSMFPLTSPIVMMVRIPHGVPLWQELLSLGLLFGTCLACVWISGKIYRIGILLYGKKPNLKEMVKWIRYK